MHHNPILPCYFTSPAYFSFFNTMNNAYVKKWTGILLLDWDSSKIEGKFRAEDREKLTNGKAYVFICAGQVINVSFSLNVSLDFLNREFALRNLLLLIRIFEGLVDQPKIKAAEAFSSIDDVLQLPKVIEIDCNSIIGYSLLANEQALKDKIELAKWPDIIE